MRDICRQDGGLQGLRGPAGRARAALAEVSRCATLLASAFAPAAARAVALAVALVCAAPLAAQDAPAAQDARAAQDAPAASAAALGLDAAEVRRQLAAGVRHGLLFEIARGDRRAWLFGTMHVGRPGVLPLDAEVMRAVGQSRAVAVEIDVTDTARMQEAVARHAMYPAGRSLADDLAPEQRAALDGWLAERGVPAAAAYAMRPWMLGSTLLVLEAQRIGLSPALGADVVLLGLARAAGKPVRELETVDAQFAALAAGTPQEQAGDLAELVAGLRAGTELDELRRIADAWTNADLAGIETALAQMRDDPRASARRSFDIVVLGRNRGLAESVDRLAREQPVVAAIGALHLVGADSVLDELARLGWTVTRR